MKKINFEAGTQVSPAKVTIDDVEHNVTPAVYEGNTPLSPFVLNTLQDNIEKEFQVNKTTISGKTSQEGTPSPTNIVPIKNVNVSNVDENGYGTLTLNLQKDTDTKTVTLISKRLHEDDSVDENGFHYKKRTIVYSGAEEVTINSNFTSTFEIRLPQKSVRGICSHYKSFSSASQLGTADGIYLLSSGACIITDLRFTKVDDFKAMLATQYTNGTPVTVEYELTEQENEQFNETNQTAWNTLENLLINGYTFIDSSSDELQPTITLTEYTANEIYRENVEKFKELDNRDVYSTEEQIIGKWIDGKSLLYRKTMQVPMSNIATSVSSGNSYTFVTGITNIGIAFVDECHSCFIRKNGTMANGISPAANWESEFVGVLDDGRVQLYIGSAIFSDISDVVLTLIYTKR